MLLNCIGVNAAISAVVSVVKTGKEIALICEVVSTPMLLLIASNWLLLIKPTSAGDKL